MSSTIPHLDGLQQMADRFDVFFLDIFGLLHNGVTLYPGTINCLEQLKKAGKKICLVSNTPRLPENVTEDLLAKGLAPHLYDDIATAGLSSRVDLERNHQGKKIWYTGKGEFTGFITGLDLKQVEKPEQADLIINAISGLTTESDAMIYIQLSAALNANKPMLCANPDMVVHIGKDQFLCGGTYAAWYQSKGGIVTYHGKPYPDIYMLALQKMGNPPRNRVCVMGDALHTDIQGANRMGFAGIWVLCGIHWEELRVSPTSGAPDLDRVAETITISPHKPIATLTEFNW